MSSLSFLKRGAPVGALGAVLACVVPLVASAGPTPPVRATSGLPAASVAGGGVSAPARSGPGDVNTPFVVLGYNDLGMHCMNSDYSEIMVLPPFNNLHAQVLRRGEEPDIITSDVTVRYSIPDNTHSADKSNFWTYPQPALLGTPAPNIGVTGNGMSGVMAATAQGDWAVTGIPIVPIDDLGRESPYALATITVEQAGVIKAQTRAVVPTSTEMSCNLCHNAPGISTASDILSAHDRLHGTSLMSQRPVACAACHADNALGAPGQPGVPNLSAAMHGAHATRMGQVSLPVDCYACHPGVRTQCQRDIHLSNGMTCLSCHGDMAAVGNPTRRPWLDEPRCGSCHVRQGFEFEQAGTLYKDSVGHGGVHCQACHGSTHAVTPTVTAADNAQAILLQGHPGVINDCLVCHTVQPGESFFHRVIE